jgi:hypothetical protein
VGEEKISKYSFMTLSSCLCCLERSFMEALDVVAIFFSL